MQGLSEEVVLRPRTGRVLAVAIIVIASLAFAGLLSTGDLTTFARSAAPLGLLGFGAWVLFWHPAVRVDPSHVDFINLVRTVRIAWPAIREVQTRWSLTVVTDDGTFTAWAAPKPTRIAGGLSSRRNMFGLLDYTRPDRHDAASPRANGEVASLVVQQQWEQYRDLGLLGAVEGPAVAVQWHVTTIVVLTGLVAGWVLALVIH